MKKILILGSSGQVGAYLTDYLRDKGNEVLEFDITNGSDQDMTMIPNGELEAKIYMADFVYFLAFDVGGSHYLKKYQDRIAHYLLTKSYTERAYFDTFIDEYNKVKAGLVEESQVPNGETKEFLEQMLIQCQTEIDKLGS